ncbi:hypothetical protein [Lactiplantibacillus xiangfangensis]|nr:hypothetical protein [Lactiplantibacillus xiangfangensis]
MGIFADFHVLPGTHTSSHSANVSNVPLGGFYSFILSLASALKGLF